MSTVYSKNGDWRMSLVRKILTFVTLARESAWAPQNAWQEPRGKEREKVKTHNEAWRQWFATFLSQHLNTKGAVWGKELSGPWCMFYFRVWFDITMVTLTPSRARMAMSTSFTCKHLEWRKSSSMEHVIQKRRSDTEIQVTSCTRICTGYKCFITYRRTNILI